MFSAGTKNSGDRYGRHFFSALLLVILERITLALPSVCKARLPGAESNRAHVRFTRQKNCRVYSVLHSATVEVAWSITHRSRMFFVTLILFAATVGLPGRAYASSNPLDLNGGSCLVMAGKDCVAMAVDRRFGLEEQLVSAEAKRVLKINGQLLCGFTGLWTDVMTVMQDLSFEVALKAIAENNRPISPAALAGLLSTLLYAHRGSPFFVEPVIAGLDSRGKPFLCGQDILGACVETDNFVVAGTSANSLYGTCEAFFRVGMDKEKLFRAAARCLLSALERDCLSGYGAVVHLITKDGIETREVTTRMD